MARTYRKVRSPVPRKRGGPMRDRRKRRRHEHERQFCSWCHNPLARNGECSDCDPHKKDKRLKRKRAYLKDERRVIESERAENDERWSDYYMGTCPDCQQESVACECET